MTVLITGGAGFIGSHLCRRLCQRGERVIVLDDFSSGNDENLAGLSEVEVIRDDVCRLANHHGRLAGVTQIVHLAALISGYESLHAPDPYVHTNVLGMHRLVELARALDNPHIVFASSSTVYGNQADAVRTEQTTPAPLTTYALSKLTGEHILSMYRELYGYTYVALRLFNVYGPHQRPDHPYANVTCKFAHSAATDRRVKLYGDGAQSRDFVYVDDVVDAIVAALDRPNASQIINIGTGKDASILELLSTVAAIAEQPFEVEELDAWPNDIREIRADISLARAELDFEPRVDLQEGLARTVSWFRAIRSPSHLSAE